MITHSINVTFINADIKLFHLMEIEEYLNRLEKDIKIKYVY